MQSGVEEHCVFGESGTHFLCKMSTSEGIDDPRGV